MTRPSSIARMWDGEAFGYIPVTMRPDELLCPECEGSGSVHCSNARGGFEYPSIEVCGHCDGKGVLEIETLEDEQ
jgi:DnaJ-class molecular chaperone